MLNGLDLFSGIGGNSLGLRDYINTIAYCEKDRYAQSVLLSRMGEGLLKPAPIWDDIETLKGCELGNIDIIVGGFPCQDISVAGRGAGLAGKRSGLFYELCRLVKEVNPKFVFLENVPAIRTRGLREVIREFTNMGYDCRWTCVSAAEVGAPHLRKRWFMLAYSHGEFLRKKQIIIKKLKDKTILSNDGEAFLMANPSSSGLQRQREITIGTTKKLADIIGSGWWETEPSVGRVANGVSNSMDKIKCLGNAVVPAQAKKAFERLIGLD